MLLPTGIVPRGNIEFPVGRRPTLLSDGHILAQSGDGARQHRLAVVVGLLTKVFTRRDGNIAESLRSSRDTALRLAGTPQQTLERWRTLKQAASRAIVEAGGTISHHHGIGKDHLPYLEAEKGPVGINTLNRVFSYLDPNRQMNPGKLLP